MLDNQEYDPETEIAKWNNGELDRFIFYEETLFRTYSRNIKGSALDIGHF
jgi:hypothetical protein